jgi:hypothetical protein
VEARIVTIEPAQVIPGFVRRLFRLGPMPPVLALSCKNSLEKEWSQESYPVQLNHDIASEGVDCILITITACATIRQRQEPGSCWAWLLLNCLPGTSGSTTVVATAPKPKPPEMAYKE